MNEPSSEFSSPGNSENRLSKNRIFHFWRCFWLTFLFVSLAYAWHCFYAPSNKIVWAENYTIAQQQAASSGKPIILFFTGQWCVPCRIMKREVWADEEVKTIVNAQFIPVAIDVADPDNAAIITRYNVGGPPVTIITDPQGNALRWRAGRIEKAEFVTLLSEPNSSAALQSNGTLR